MALLVYATGNQSLSRFWKRTPPTLDLDASTESFVPNFGSKYLRTGLGVINFFMLSIAEEC